MINRHTTILLALLLVWAGIPLGTATAAAVQAQQVNVETFGEKVTVDGKKKPMTVRPSLIQGKVYVPLRAFVPALGGAATYDAKKQTVKATLGKTTVVVTGTSGAATVNGKKASVKPAPIIRDKELYVSAESFAEWFGYEFVQQGANGQFNKAYYYPDGSYYVGPLVGGIPEGKGKIKFKSGDKYEGDVRKGKANGVGEVVLKSGGAYAGSFQDNQYEGQGVYITKAGTRYAGMFSESKLNGLAAQYDGLTQGDVELGHYTDSLRHGKGIYVEDGQMYETLYEKGKLASYKATERLKAVKFEDGSLAVFEQNSAGEPNGQAYFIGPDGAAFTGTVQTSDGHTVLTGTTSYVNGTQYTGVYVDGRPHGLGMASSKASKSGLLLEFQGGRMAKAYSFQAQQAKQAPGPLVAIEPRNAEPVQPRGADSVDPRPADPIQPRPADPVQPRPADPIQPRPADPVQPRPADPIQPRPADPGQPRPADPIQPRPADPVQPRPADPIQPRPADPVQPRPADPIQPRPADPVQPRPADPIQPRPADPVQPGFAEPIEPRMADAIIPSYAVPVVPFYSAPVEPFFSNIIEQFHAPDVRQRRSEIIKGYRASEIDSGTADTLRSRFDSQRLSYEPPKVSASSGTSPTPAQIDAYTAMTTLSLSVFSGGSLSYTFGF